MNNNFEYSNNYYNICTNYINSNKLLKPCNILNEDTKHYYNINSPDFKRLKSNRNFSYNLFNLDINSKFLLSILIIHRICTRINA